MLRSKKGIIPLVATLLLIALAVILGAVVLNFSQAQLEVTARCSVDIGLKMVNLNNKPQVCFDRATNQLFAIVENGPQLPIVGLRLRIIGEKEIFVQDIPESGMDKDGVLLKYVAYDPNSYGEIKQVRFTPKVSLYDEEVVCSEQALTLEPIRDCEK